VSASPAAMLAERLIFSTANQQAKTVAQLALDWPEGQLTQGDMLRIINRAVAAGIEIGLDVACEAREVAHG